MPEIIEITSWNEWKPKEIISEGYVLLGNESVHTAIDRFTSRFCYEPDTVWVLGKQVRIERKEAK